jgi:hypothetical protein
VPEANLFSIGERLFAPINRIALASDITVFGGHYGEQTYYADYAGIAAKYAPKAILEIGVRFGYSGISMCYGALQSFKPIGRQKLIYKGMDGEFFSAEMEGGDPGKLYPSNTVAARNFDRFFVDEKLTAQFFKVDTQKEPFPDEIKSRQYGLINVDGDHSYDGAMLDCVACWQLLQPGGLMLVDDITFDRVGPAVREFIGEMEELGEKVEWQYHENERGLMIIRKGEVNG